MTVIKEYVPLHVHSHYSLLDGLSKPDQIANRCSKIGASSCALTDHGNIAGTVKFHNAMKKKGIKPILGCELYISSQDSSVKNNDNKKLSHLCVLAKNYKGWKTLIKIISESNRESNYYYKPRLDLNKLGELLDGNIIGFAGHLGSILSNSICENDSISKEWKNKGLECANKLIDIFGKDNFFLEAQLLDYQHNPIQQDVTECVRELAKLTGLKTICTPDAHYSEKEDAIDQRILLCTNLKTTIADINKKILNQDDFGMDCFFKSDNYHIPSFEEIKDLHTEEEISNTLYVDSLIENYEINQKPLLPNFICPDGFDQDSYLRQLCRQGWKERVADRIPKEQHQVYIDRINSELQVLQGANLSSYFLIIQDILGYVRSNNWLAGPGRGCFVPGTLVKMSDGTNKSIEDIIIGDKVIDAYGEKQEVYDILQYDINEDIIELEFENGIIIRCTKDHKFLTKNRGWVEAQYLDQNDDIVEV